MQRVLNILRYLLRPGKICICGAHSRNITFKLGANVQPISNLDGILGSFIVWNTSPGTTKKSVTGKGGVMP